MRSLRANCYFQLMFQSSPAPRRGRYTTTPPASFACAAFQSSPAPRRGRYQVVVDDGLTGQHVSILARAEARALHVIDVPVAYTEIVSILARAEARALLAKMNGKRWEQ